MPRKSYGAEEIIGKLRDECLNRERFDTLLEAQILIEQWRLEYNNLRPHSALGYRPPAPESWTITDAAILPLEVPALS